MNHQKDRKTLDPPHGRISLVPPNAKADEFGFDRLLPPDPSFLPWPERFSSILWSAGTERSGDPAFPSSLLRGRIHQTVPLIRIGRRCSLSPRERAGVRGNGASNCIV